MAPRAYRENRHYGAGCISLIAESLSVTGLGVGELGKLCSAGGESRCDAYVPISVGLASQMWLPINQGWRSRKEPFSMVAGRGNTACDGGFQKFLEVGMTSIVRTNDCLLV